MGTGDQSNAWGSVLNSQVFGNIDQALGSPYAANVAGNSDVTLSQANALNLAHNLTGVLTGSINYIFPASAGRIVIINNGTSGSFTVTVKASGGTGVVVPQGTRQFVLLDSAANTAYLLNAGINANLTGQVISVGNATTIAIASINDFRLTLSTGIPVTTSDVTGAATLYCTPYKGSNISLYDGSLWHVRSSAEFSIALGTLSSGKPYDVFCYDNSGTPTLELLAWTNDTTRATALTYQDGILSKTGALTRRYLGTFYTTATTTTEDSASRRYLFNYYNRSHRSLYATDPTSSWNYTTLTIRAANANTTYGQGRVGIMTGVSEDAAIVTHTAVSNNGTAGTGQYSGIGINSTTVINGIQAINTDQAIVMATSFYNSILPLGANYLQALEASQAIGTTTWYGASGISSAPISGISGVCYA